MEGNTLSWIVKSSTSTLFALQPLKFELEFQTCVLDSFIIMFTYMWDFISWLLQKDLNVLRGSYVFSLINPVIDMYDGGESSDTGSIMNSSLSWVSSVTSSDIESIMNSSLSGVSSVSSSDIEYSSVWIEQIPPSSLFRKSQWRELLFTVIRSFSHFRLIQIKILFCCLFLN